MTQRLYRDDPYLLEFEAEVVSRRDHGGRPAVVLDRTAFYAESGGQPSDQGVLGGVAVLEVIEDGGEVVHVLGAALAGERVRGLVDADRRRDHRQQHHGQHLLSRAFVRTAGAGTVSFHLGAEHCTIDLDREVGDEQARAAETLANQVIWDARPVAVRTVTRKEALALGVTPPEEAGDTVRLVEAEGFDLQPCGGTHPRSTAEVGVVIVVGRERHKGGSRVRFVCGHRALTLIRRRNAILDSLGTHFSAPAEALPEAATRLLDGLAEANRRAAHLLDRALDGEARRLLSGASADAAGASSAPAIVVATYDAWPAADLRTLAQRLVALAPCVALLASRSDAAYLVFAQTDGLGHDIPALLRAAVETVDGRGGGKGNLAQGGGDRLDRLPEALDAAAAAVRARG
ncbi:MAG: DHHA1 domain-containing protein [Solirubrobacterales bacterium]